MNGGRLARLRWRRRGAWLWPTFTVLTVLDALIGQQLPPAGDTETLVAAALLGCILNLIAVILLSRPVEALLRRARPDLPSVVAHNYAGTCVVVAVTAALLIAGLAHRPSVVAHRNALAEAVARAEAWIGDRAPAQFRRDAAQISTFTIQAGSVYRSCVHSTDGRRSFCVIVKPRLPFNDSVSFAGYEPNSVFAQGAG